MLPQAEVRQQCGLPALPIYLSHSRPISLSLSLADIACKLQRLESALSHCRSLTKRVTCVQTSAARRVILIYGIDDPPPPRGSHSRAKVTAGQCFGRNINLTLSGSE